MLLLRRLSSPVGPLTLASDGDTLAGLWFEHQRHFGLGLPAETVEGDCVLFDTAEAWLRDYFAGLAPDPKKIPLAPYGTAFQQRVRAAMQAIPYGTASSYGALAERLHSSPRAVGQAVGRNPVGILVPCHRVLGANGALTGYAAGLAIKRKLLELEGIAYK